MEATAATAVASMLSRPATGTTFPSFQVSKNFEFADSACAWLDNT